MPIEKNNQEYIEAYQLGFTTYINKIHDMIQTTDASAVWVYLISKPANWIVYKSELEKRYTNLGKHKLNQAFKHLKELGLIEVKPHRGSDGKMLGKITIVRCVPKDYRITDSEHFGDRTTYSPTVGPSATTNNINNNNNINNSLYKEKTSKTKKSKNGKKKSFPEDFFLTDELRAYAIEHGVVDPDLLYEQLKNYCASTGKQYKCYPSTYQSWVLREKKSITTRRIYNGKQSNEYDYGRKAAEELQRLYESGMPNIP